MPAVMAPSPMMATARRSLPWRAAAMAMPSAALTEVLEWPTVKVSYSLSVGVGKGRQSTALLDGMQPVAPTRQHFVRIGLVATSQTSWSTACHIRNEERSSVRQCPSRRRSGRRRVLTLWIRNSPQLHRSSGSLAGGQPAQVRRGFDAAQEGISAFGLGHEVNFMAFVAPHAQGARGFSLTSATQIGYGTGSGSCRIPAYGADSRGSAAFSVKGSGTPVVLLFNRISTFCWAAFRAPWH